MKSVIRAVLLIVTAALCAALVSPALAQGAEKFVVQEDFVLLNPCTEELVHVTGPVTFISREVSEPDGTEHFLRVIISPELSAIGVTSGTEYQVRETLQQVIVRPQGFEEGVLTANAVSTVALVSPGPSDNFRFVFQFHLTLDAGGVVRVDTTVRSVTCVG